MSGVRPVDLNQPLFSSGEFSPEGEALNNNTLKTRQHPFLPEASFGLRVLSLPASVCVCVRVCASTPSLSAR